MIPAIRWTLLALTASACSQAAPPPVAPKPALKKVVAKPALAPLIAKMRHLNALMEQLVGRHKAADDEGGKEVAQRIVALSANMDPEADLRPGYGEEFAVSLMQLRAAAQAMVGAAGRGGEAAGKGLRTLHDTCLRCHDQAPAAQNVSVCQLSD